MKMSGVEVLYWMLEQFLQPPRPGPVHHCQAQARKEEGERKRRKAVVRINYGTTESPSGNQWVKNDAIHR